MSLDHLVLHPQSPDPGWTESQLNYKFMPKYECDYFITLRRIDYSCKLSRISINHVCMVYNRPLNKKNPKFWTSAGSYISEFVNSRNLCERSEPPTRLKRKEICEHRTQWQNSRKLGIAYQAESGSHMNQKQPKAKFGVWMSVPLSLLQFYRWQFSMYIAGSQR